MLMSAEEYVAENSNVPACYDSIGGVCIIFTHTKDKYVVEFLCDIYKVIKDGCYARYDTKQDFLDGFNKVKPEIDECFTNLRRIKRECLDFVYRILGRKHDLLASHEIDRYLETSRDIEIGFTNIQVCKYVNNTVIFVSDYRENLFFVAKISDEDVEKLDKLNAKWLKEVERTNNKFREICK